MLTWTPTNELPLFDYLETQTDVSHTISVATDDIGQPGPVAITGFTVTPDSIPDQVEITFVGNVLEVSAPDLIGMFPILTIKYLLNGVIGECFDFDDVPDEAEEVIEYRKEPISPRIFILEVTAVDYSGVQTKEYEMIVRADYTPGRNRLILEVLERS